MSNINDNSLSSEGNHPNRGLTLENLSVKSLNKNLNKSLNSLNNSSHKNSNKKKIYNNNSSKKSNNINLNLKNKKQINNKTSPKQQKNNQTKKNKPKSNNNNNNNYINNNTNNKNNINYNNISHASSNNQNKSQDDSSSFYNYFNYNEVCLENDNYLSALNEALAFIDNTFEELNISDKINKLLEITNDESKKVRLGALVGIYLIIKQNYNSLDENIKNIILNNIISLLQSYEQQDEQFLLSCLEICSLFGPHEILIENFGVICMFLTDFNFPKLQLASFHCLMCTEYHGISILIELASKDEQDYQRYILNQLIHTPHIQRIIIINAIFNELYSNDYKKRNIALSAINRLNYLLNEEDTLQKIVDLFNEPKIDNQFVASILRNKYGEKYLLNELKNNKNENIRKAICSVLCYRFPKKIIPLKIKLDNVNNSNISNMNMNMPGSFYTYQGKVCPVLVPCSKNIDEILENEEVEYEERKNHLNKVLNMINDTSEDWIEISQRDFLAALQRMIQIQYDHKNPQLIFDENNSFNFLDHLKLNVEPINDNKNEENEEKENIDDNQNENENDLNLNINQEKNKKENNIYFYIRKYNNILGIKSNNQNTNEDLEELDTDYEYISEEVIKALGKCLSDYSTKVRDAAATSIGVIGLPEASIAIDDLIDNINDEDVNVKSKIIWDVGRIAPAVENSAINEVAFCIQNNMWKVKKATLYTLSQFGNRCNKNIIPYLINLLRESAINKQLIAETIVKLGIEGENALLLMMNSEPDNNYKLKSAVIRGYSFADITSPNIDFILESIFKQSNNEFPAVRKACIFTIHELAERAQENITYLKKKNIIPFYYEKLKDKDINIQGYAINCIKSLGAEGELIFIEGFTKDNNYLTRINCGLGLADNGIQNMRTLLLGLQDKNKNVRNAIEKVIIVKMPISEVVNYFNNEGQLLSLKYTIKELLDKKNYLQLVTLGYLEKLLSTIEEYEENSGALGEKTKKESDNLKNINSINPDEEGNNDYYQEEDIKN
jgi:HEAT repeat protein